MSRPAMRLRCLSRRSSVMILRHGTIRPAGQMPTARSMMKNTSPEGTTSFSTPIGSPRRIRSILTTERAERALQRGRSPICLRSRCRYLKRTACRCSSAGTALPIPTVCAIRTNPATAWWTRGRAPMKTPRSMPCTWKRWNSSWTAKVTRSDRAIRSAV